MLRAAVDRHVARPARDHQLARARPAHVDLRVEAFRERSRLQAAAVQHLRPADRDCDFGRRLAQVAVHPERARLSFHAPRQVDRLRLRPARVRLEDPDARAQVALYAIGRSPLRLDEGDVDGSVQSAHIRHELGRRLTVSECARCRPRRRGARLRREHNDSQRCDGGDEEDESTRKHGKSGAVSC